LPRCSCGQELRKVAPENCQDGDLVMNRTASKKRELPRHSKQPRTYRRIVTGTAAANPSFKVMNNCRRKCFRQRRLHKFTVCKCWSNFNDTRSSPRGLNTLGFTPLRHSLCFVVQYLAHFELRRIRACRVFFAFTKERSLRHVAPEPNLDLGHTSHRRRIVSQE
jgi:hypothetical protein